MTDQHTVYNSRMFCTRWNGLEKGSIFDDALDDKEYEGNLIYLLKSGSEFIRNNSKVRFVKEAQYRVDKPDYAERAVTEALVNALIHRDYIVLGSEIHIDMLDVYKRQDLLFLFHFPHQQAYVFLLHLLDLPLHLDQYHKSCLLYTSLRGKQLQLRLH